MTDAIQTTASDIMLAQFGDDYAKLVSEQDFYLSLLIPDLSDSKQLKVVHDARMSHVRARNAVEDRRKELKRDSLETGRLIDGEARRIKALIAPGEEHLAAEEQRVTDELERIETERADILRARMAQLFRIGSRALPGEIAPLDGDAFEARLAADTATHEELTRRMGALRDAESPLLEVAVAAMTPMGFTETLASAVTLRDAKRAKVERTRQRMDLLRTVDYDPYEAEIEDLSDDEFVAKYRAAQAAHEETKAELKRQSDAREAALQLRERMAELVALGSDEPEDLVSGASPDEFTAMLERAVTRRDREAKRLADEQSQRDLDDEQLRRDQEKLEADRLKLERAQLDALYETRTAQLNAIGSQLDLTDIATVPQDEYDGILQIETDLSSARALLIEERKPEAEKVLEVAEAVSDMLVPNVWCTDDITAILLAASAEIRALTGGEW